jgi:hypothetical protein
VALDASTNPRRLGLDVLASGRQTIGVNEPGARLYADTLQKDAWYEPAHRNLDAIRGVIAVHRLREVTCLYGFTRFAPAPTAADSEIEDIQLAVRGASIAQHADWPPAIEQSGEGVFVHFDSSAAHSWLARADVSQRLDVLHDGFSAHRRKYPGSAEQRFPGGPYILLHSLAHALITKIALDCGYPASSPKERIYAFPASSEFTARHGLLIYTAATGAQGTLGDLVACAKSMAQTLEQALNRLSRLPAHRRNPLRAAQHLHRPRLAARNHGRKPKQLFLSPIMLGRKTFPAARRWRLKSGYVRPASAPYGWLLRPRITHFVLNRHSWIHISSATPRLAANTSIGVR